MTAADPGYGSSGACALSLSLFDLRGSFLEFIVFYCTWWGIWGMGEEEELVLIGYTFRNFYQSHV